MLRTASTAALSLALALGVPAQGENVNFEIHPVDPIDLAVVENHPYLLVCNTADNSVEIYDAITFQFVQRVGVGLRPVTVRWHQALSAFYTANFLGDSISAVILAPPAPGMTPVARLERTDLTGDEPTDIAFSPDGTVAFVTLQGQSAMALHDVFTLAPLGGLSGLRITLGSSVFDPQPPFALKNPRRIYVTDELMLAMGQRGGNSANYDFDIWSLSLLNGHEEAMAGLGSTNWNLEPGRDGKWYAVGGFARNDIDGSAALSAIPTGFVRSELSVITGLGTPQSFVEKRDLNLDDGGSVEPIDQALAQPTDVALLHVNDEVTKVFVAGFSSDRIEVLHPNDGPPSSWPQTYIDLPNTSIDHSRTGPRGLYMFDRGPMDVTGPKLFSYNALNKTVSVISAATETEITRFALQQDPTAPWIHTGREFLYSAEHSGHGFVSCSSCHTDGTTDGLGWNLGEIGGGPGMAIQPHLLDSLFGPPNFPTDKGLMITQTLQGLVNHPVDLEETQYLFTNAPYHWRGDKNDFVDFNEAFVNLQGKANIHTPDDPKGVTDSEMRAYRSFINTIMYPGNPEQNWYRRYFGDLGDPNGEDGSGALRGLKIFHTAPLDNGLLGNRSCVQCHWLPESSNNRLTEVLGGQPIETAATRGVFSREGRNEKGALSLTNTVNGEFGLLHLGVASNSLNSFTFNTFNAFLSNPGITLDLIRFMREFDWGTAPAVGKSITLDVGNINSIVATNAFDIVETNVRDANTGAAAAVRSNLVETFYYYDLTANPAGWREEGSANVISTVAMRAMVQAGNDRIVLTATEAGSERRVANPTGNKTPLAGAAPSNITLEPMTAATQWEHIPSLTKNWVPGTGPNEWNFNGPGPDPISVKTVRIYQQALIAKAPQFGLTQMRHEAPRRFAVAGDDIRHGAKLVIAIPADATTPPPYPNSDQNVQILATEIFPTDRTTDDGRQIWETTLEADPMTAYALMLGGPFAPDVVSTFFSPGAEPPLPTEFDPLAWNWYHVAVVNEDFTVGDGGWQRLTLE